MKTNLENLIKAAACAELLASDVLAAHSSSCVHGDCADTLLRIALYPLIAEARRIADALAKLSEATSEKYRPKKIPEELS